MSAAISMSRSISRSDRIERKLVYMLNMQSGLWSSQPRSHVGERVRCQVPPVCRVLFSDHDEGDCPAGTCPLRACPVPGEAVQAVGLRRCVRVPGGDHRMVWVCLHPAGVHFRGPAGPVLKGSCLAGRGRAYLFPWRVAFVSGCCVRGCAG